MKYFIVSSLLFLAAANLVLSKSLLQDSETKEDDDDIIEKSDENERTVNSQEKRNSEDLTAEIKEVPIEVIADGSDFINLRIAPEEEKSLRRSFSDNFSGSEEESKEDKRNDKNESNENSKQSEILKKLTEEIIQSTKEYAKKAQNNLKSHSKESHEKNNKEKDSNESFEEGGHRHRNAPESEKSSEIVFSFETLEVEPVAKAGFDVTDEDSSKIPDEDSSKMPTSRLGVADVIRGTRRMLNRDLLQNKLGIQHHLTESPDHLDGDNNSPIDRISAFQSKFPFFNQQLLHGAHSSPLHDRTGILHDQLKLLRSGRSEEAFSERLDPDNNSYPYTAPTSRPNLGTRWFGDHGEHTGNSGTHPLNSQLHLPGFFNLYEQNFSPIKHPIFGGRFSL